jgi:glycosyltransferase involved in cell wall biosynthesis
MLKGRRVIVVVPAHAEEAHVGAVIATMPGFVDAIIVVDDGSPDRTSAVAQGAGDPRVRVVRHRARRGVGAAIATGYDEALRLTRESDDAVAVMAGDGQMDPADLGRVVGPIVMGAADYVKGTRFGDPGVRHAMGWPRFLGGHVFSWLTARAIGRPITDSQCGYTAIARGALAAFDRSRMWQSFGYPNDLLGLLAASGLRIEQVPVRAIYGSEVSKLRLRHLPPIFFLIARAAVRRRRAPELVVTRAGDTRPRDLRDGPAVSS